MKGEFRVPFYSRGSFLKDSPSLQGAASNAANLRIDIENDGHTLAAQSLPRCATAPATGA
jgi:hypothetical protein